MILAAAMLRLRPSPPTSAVCRQGNPGTGRPSISAWAGRGTSARNASRMASWVARRMFTRSIARLSRSAKAQTTPGVVVSNS